MHVATIFMLEQINVIDVKNDYNFSEFNYFFFSLSVIFKSLLFRFSENDCSFSNDERI